MLAFKGGKTDRATTQFDERKLSSCTNPQCKKSLHIQNKGNSEPTQVLLKVLNWNTLLIPLPSLTSCQRVSGVFVTLPFASALPPFCSSALVICWPFANAEADDEDNNVRDWSFVSMTDSSWPSGIEGFNVWGGEEVEDSGPDMVIRRLWAGVLKCRNATG